MQGRHSHKYSGTGIPVYFTTMSAVYKHKAYKRHFPVEIQAYVDQANNGGNWVYSLDKVLPFKKKIDQVFMYFLFLDRIVHCEWHELCVCVF